jgi:hypothetical protein
VPSRFDDVLAGALSAGLATSDCVDCFALKRLANRAKAPVQKIHMDHRQKWAKRIAFPVEDRHRKP